MNEGSDDWVEKGIAWLREHINLLPTIEELKQMANKQEERHSPTLWPNFREHETYKSITFGSGHVDQEWVELNEEVYAEVADCVNVCAELGDDPAGRIEELVNAELPAHEQMTIENLCDERYCLEEKIKEQAAEIERLKSDLKVLRNANLYEIRPGVFKIKGT